MKESPKERLMGVLFTLPALILFILFTIIPVIYIFYYSLFDFAPGGPMTFVGLNNFFELFKSKEFWIALGNNLKFLVIAVPLWTMFPLIIAILLFEKVKGWKFFKSAFYFPGILSVTIMSTIFRTMFFYDGPVNGVLSLLGIPPVEFWASSNIAIVLIVIYINWVGFGGAALMFLSALANFSDSIYEAAIMDGANWGQRLFKIELPLLKPMFSVVLLLNTIAVFAGLFASIFMMTSGGPGYSTTTLEYLLYTSAFETHRFGYSSAIAVVLFFMLLILGLIQSRVTNVSEGEL